MWIDEAASYNVARARRRGTENGGDMRAYILTSGSIFALILLAHLLRIFAEPHVLREPLWILLTLAAGGLAFWAFRVLRLVH